MPFLFFRKSPGVGAFRWASINPRRRALKGHKLLSKHSSIHLFHFLDLWFKNCRIINKHFLANNAFGNSWIDYFSSQGWVFPTMAELEVELRQICKGFSVKKTPNPQRWSNNWERGSKYCFAIGYETCRVSKRSSKRELCTSMTDSTQYFPSHKLGKIKKIIKYARFEAQRELVRLSSF